MPVIINKLKSGFTLIELLIVVAIIAILAAIAVPNFLEAQTRAKVSRVRADHRTIATGLEVYHIDINKYPLCNGNNWAFRTEIKNGQRLTMERLTTPIAYLTGKASFIDPFKGTSYWEGPNLEIKTPLKQDNAVIKDIGQLYWYTARNAADSAVWDQEEAATTPPKWWFLQSCGPDLAYDFVYKMLNPMTVDSSLTRLKVGTAIYDATNGTVSKGSIWRVGGTPTGTGKSFYYMVQQSNT